MRRLIGVATVALLGATSSPALAQVSLGFRAGLSYAHLAGEIETDSRTRLTAGAFAGFEVVRNLAVHADVSYVQKGAKTQSGVFDPVQGPIEIKQTTTLDYIEFQLPAVLTMPVRNEQVRPRLLAGPALAVSVNCRIETVSTPGGALPPFDCASDTKTADFGVVLGVGVEYGRGPGAFLADIRYDVGLINISNVPDDPSKKNRSLQLLVGYIRHL